MTSGKGHILLLTRHYPPAVSGGARRPYLLTSGLRERGWRVTVATPIKPDAAEDWIETPHPAGLRGYSAQTTTGQAQELGIEHIKTSLRRLLYWPDGDMRWAFCAVRSVRAAALRPDWIVSTSPPESAHLAARLVQKRTGARWLAELRDSWIDDPLRAELRQSSLRRSVERRIARRLLSRATRLVAVSEAIAAEARQFQSPAQAAPIVIGHFAARTTHTYEFDGLGPHVLHTGRFSLSHPERRIKTVLDEFNIALSHAPTAKLHLVGLLTAEERDQVRTSPRVSNIVCHGEVSHQEALAMQAAADALVLFQPETEALPGKLSEYLLTSAPILTVGAGPWMRRLIEFPHFPLSKLDIALRSGRREIRDDFAAAIDAYEAIFRGD